MSEALLISKAGEGSTPNLIPGGELAGPQGARPVNATERIAIVDVVRGFALLGILLMNIPEFSGPQGIDGNPTLVGTHPSWNIGVWAVVSILFEGKMRGAFSMLFGAGVILLTDRAEARGLGARVGDIFARRNLWLLLFGVLDGYFLWFGDILYWYGLMALVFLYPFRRAGPKLLWSAGLVALLLAEIPAVSPIVEHWSDRQNLISGERAKAAGQKLTNGQKKALEEQAKRTEQRRKERAADVQHMRGGYWEITKTRAKEVKQIESDFLYFFGFGDPLGMMLIGMALLRTGFLRGSLANRAYVLTAGACYLLVITVSGWSVITIVQSHFASYAYIGMNLSYEWTRLAGTLANISVVILVCKRGWFQPLVRSLAAVGQMALTNYILTSVLCVLYFYGYGLKRYGQLEYHQLFYVVGVVWVVLIAFSTVWLRYFQFGPMEWIWRSLTYWRRQPMRLRQSSALPVAMGEATA